MKAEGTVGALTCLKSMVAKLQKQEKLELYNSLIENGIKRGIFAPYPSNPAMGHHMGSRNLYQRTKLPLRTRLGRSSTKGAIAPGSELGIQRSDREGLAHGMIPPYPR
jgi:hypothetical protein